MVFCYGSHLWARSLVERREKCQFVNAMLPGRTEDSSFSCRRINNFTRSLALYFTAAFRTSWQGHWIRKKTNVASTSGTWTEAGGDLATAFFGSPSAQFQGFWGTCEVHHWKSTKTRFHRQTWRLAMDVCAQATIWVKGKHIRRHSSPKRSSGLPDVSSFKAPLTGYFQNSI